MQTKFTLKSKTNAKFTSFLKSYVEKVTVILCFTFSISISVSYFLYSAVVIEYV